jgi:predicted membrane GTPase involved in stress response
LQRQEIPLAYAGDIIAISGIEPLNISDTLCDPTCVEALPPLVIDEPTISMIFQINDSPFVGKEGKFVTSRQIRERLENELKRKLDVLMKLTAQKNFVFLAVVNCTYLFDLKLCAAKVLKLLCHVPRSLLKKSMVKNRNLMKR